MPFCQQIFLANNSHNISIKSGRIKVNKAKKTLKNSLSVYEKRRRGGGHIVFGADPVGVGVSAGVGVGVSVTLSCLHDISRTGGWILTKFARM